MTLAIAIVGRPNVGKSTLFNRMTASQQALVHDQEGVTRDRQFGEGIWEGRSFIVIDTGGIAKSEEGSVEKAVLTQAMQAVAEADIIYFVLDARQGLQPAEKDLAKELRKQQKPVFIVVNKMDGQTSDVITEFRRIGFENIYGIAANQNKGIKELLAQTFALVPPEAADESVPEEIASEITDCPKVAIIGRPNVGKSTLTNRMLGEERVIVCDMPGTTRDSIYITMERMGKSYTLIDTAGVRKKKNVVEAVEQFSVVKTLQAIKDANIVLLIFDARMGLADQDLSLIDFTIEAGRSLIICANKWDGMDHAERELVKKQLQNRLRFAEFAPIYYISALHGTGVGELFNVINEVYKSAIIDIPTLQLTTILEQAIKDHQPPTVHGRRIKLRYAHCGGRNPPTVVIHGNQTHELPLSYQKYLSKYFIKALKLKGTPVRIVCKSSTNPFAGKRNTLTPRQIHKRKRLMKHVKKK